MGSFGLDLGAGLEILQVLLGVMLGLGLSA